jgi:tetratricopeptide (TPR) repeat protein
MRHANRTFALPIRLLLLIFTIWVVAGAARAGAQTAQANDPSLRSERAIEHNSPDWALIESHLPDPTTATPAKLEMEGDILRARRFPASAMDYFHYALNRGGDRSALLNKMGVTELELGNVTLARLYIQADLKAQRKNAQAWNNLGAIEFMQRRYGDAIRDYKRAIKYDDQVAVYHSNLGLAYVDKRDFESARAQLILALKLDPDVFLHHNAAGSSLHILSTSDRTRFCFEMAKAYAKLGNEAEMLHALQTASEAGMDIQAAMLKDNILASHVNDPQVVALVHVGKSLHASRVAGGNVAGAAPTLPTASAPPPVPTPR